ncbi:larval cuticle protein 65Ag1-like [Phlebotomus argentipes]|uniref:larval cuticle protein 65Ag1-like n=1 Tax=Phlebotomus argentipes TaxID=94469 RepID=UPI002892FE19|nr:larval cuticle protein 65Ag1-like [Phlebotomus argentipes]
MMTVKFVFLLLSVNVVALALPLNYYAPDLLTYSSSRNANGYDFSYSTIDGQSRDEHGEILPLKDGENEIEVLEVRGSYSFTGDDNRIYTVNYVAGINGYHANTTITDAIPHEKVTAFVAPIVLKSLVG